MALTPIDGYSDPRITHEYATLNGQRYHYLLGLPRGGNYRATIFLIHGFPDLSVGWRYQIPMLLELGMRVVAPDMMGYGGTDAPKSPPASLSLYGMKRAADDIAALAKELGCKSIILGGHDWGGSIVWRTQEWHPDLISHLFVVCTPYAAPAKKFVPLEEIVKKLPNFKYQILLAGPEIEGAFKAREEVKTYLNAVFGGKGKMGEKGFSPEGPIWENLGKIERTRLLSERELEYYTDQYMIHGLHGPLNWYRTRKVNFEEEKDLPRTVPKIPVLFIHAEHDVYITSEMTKGRHKHIPDFEQKDIAATHWVLWQKPDEANAAIGGWLERRVLGGKSHL